MAAFPSTPFPSGRPTLPPHPQTDDQFLAISGVGQTKLQRYGPTFLQHIQQHNHD